MSQVSLSLTPPPWPSPPPLGGRPSPAWPPVPRARSRQAIRGRHQEEGAMGEPHAKIRGAIREGQRRGTQQPEAIESNRKPSEGIGRHRKASEDIGRHRKTSEDIGRHRTCTTGFLSEVCVISTMSVLTSLRSSAARGKGRRTLKTCVALNGGQWWSMVCNAIQCHSGALTCRSSEPKTLRVHCNGKPIPTGPKNVVFRGYQRVIRGHLVLPEGHQRSSECRQMDIRGSRPRPSPAP